MSSPPQMLTAYALVCPEAEAVTALVRPYGLRLVRFVREATFYALPPLPAQAHYEDDYGTQLIYLAGRDPDLA